MENVKISNVNAWDFKGSFNDIDINDLIDIFDKFYNEFNIKEHINQDKFKRIVT